MARQATLLEYLPSTRNRAFEILESGASAATVETLRQELSELLAEVQPRLQYLERYGVELLSPEEREALWAADFYVFPRYKFAKPITVEEFRRLFRRVYGVSIPPEVRLRVRKRFLPGNLPVWQVESEPVSITELLAWGARRAVASGRVGQLRRILRNIAARLAQTEYYGPWRVVVKTPNRLEVQKGSARLVFSWTLVPRPRLRRPPYEGYGERWLIYPVHLEIVGPEELVSRLVEHLRGLLEPLGLRFKVLEEGPGRRVVQVEAKASVFGRATEGPTTREWAIESLLGALRAALEKTS